jgi:ppGpp synthetase/RelA/SpoT-type nucleotidyltranferase
MDFETYARSKFADYAALAETVAAILRAAIDSYPEPFRLQQIQQRSKSPDSLRKKLENRGILATASLEDDIKDLAGCRLIFYTNSDVTRFLQSGIIQDNFDVDWPVEQHAHGCELLLHVGRRVGDLALLDVARNIERPDRRERQPALLALVY